MSIEDSGIMKMLYGTKVLCGDKFREDSMQYFSHECKEGYFFTIETMAYSSPFFFDAFFYEYMIFQNFVVRGETTGEWNDVFLLVKMDVGVD